METGTDHSGMCIDWLDTQIWRSRITIPTKLMLYNTCILPIFLYGIECWAVTKRDALKIDAFDQWCYIAKVVRNQMVPSRAEWQGETDNRATRLSANCPSTASFSVRPHCKNARRDRCQEYHNCFPFGGLEETTRTSSYYVDEDYPAKDLRSNNLSLDEAITVAQNRPLWRLMSACVTKHP